MKFKRYTISNFSTENNYKINAQIVDLYNELINSGEVMGGPITGITKYQYNLVNGIAMYAATINMANGCVMKQYCSVGDWNVWDNGDVWWGLTNMSALDTEIIYGVGNEGYHLAYYPDKGFYLSNALIYEIISINERTCALSFYTRPNDPSEIKYRCPGIAILTISNNGYPTLIAPDKHFNGSNLVCTNYLNTGARNQAKQYLFVTNKYASQRLFSNTQWLSVVGEKTILNPIIVPGAPDFCPDCFYVPVSQYKLENYQDAIFEIAGNYYYYNGFIAVKLDEDWNS